MKECKVCGEGIETTPTSRGADYYLLCPTHGRVLNDSPREREILRAVAAEVARGQVEQSIDANGCRYFKRIPPKPPRPGIVLWDDDGVGRTIDTASPHGVSVRPDRDRIFGGSDPRLDQYRDTPEGDDDAAA